MLSHGASVYQIPAAMFTGSNCPLDRHIPHSVPSTVDKAVESISFVIDPETLRHLLCREGNRTVKAEVENFWPVAECH